MARYLFGRPRRNPDLSAGRVERVAVMVVGAGLAGAVSSAVGNVGRPIFGLFGPFSKPAATLVSALGVEWGAKAIGFASVARELGDGGLVLTAGQAMSAAGLPIGISSTFPNIPGLPGGAPAPALPAGNTPTGTAMVPAAPAGGRYMPVPGYGSLSQQLGVGL